jgi:beta-N-acetylhexosaminidase
VIVGHARSGIPSIADRTAVEQASLAALWHNARVTTDDIRRQVGQLLWIGFEGLEPSPELLRRIGDGEVGAAVIFRRNIADIPQLHALNRALHAAAPADAPLLVAVDQEGGRVQRVRNPAPHWPPMLRLDERARTHGAGDATAVAERVGRAMGEELAALGFDVDFAPVLDVHTNPANPIIGDRAFATTPDLVARLAGAYARGLAHAGVLSCGKHFPGHGDTSTDSHLELPRVDHDEQRLRAIELAPFAALARDLPLIMTAHVVFGALDPAPATMSRRLLSMLRHELGFGGVIVSDDLEMKAILDHFGFEESVERALLAGCDAFLVCGREDLQRRCHDALVRAAERSSEVRDRLADAARRVAWLKRLHAAGLPPPVSAAAAEAILARADHHALAAELRG